MAKLVISSERERAVKLRRYAIPSLVSAFDVLRYLSDKRHSEATLAQISTALNLNRSTTYRVLATFETLDIVEHDLQGRVYRLGPELAVLGARAVVLNNFFKQAETVINRAAEITRNTTLLVQRVGTDKMAYTLKAEPDGTLHLGATVGQVLPVTAGSHGKVFLAYMSSEERDKLLAEHGYPASTSYTIRDSDALLRELEKVRAIGMGISWQEHVVGVCGVAVPIFRTDSENVKACISTVAMSEVTPPEQLAEWGRQIQSLILAENLGGKEP